jgi:hypothetical protein
MAHKTSKRQSVSRGKTASAKKAARSELRRILKSEVKQRKSEHVLSRPATA